MEEPTQDILTNFIELATTNLPGLLLRLVAIVLLLLVTRWLGRWLSRLVERLLQRNAVDPTVVGFLSKTVYILVMLMAFIVSLGWLGVPTNSVIAVLGASTLAIGLALQDSLANLAAGLLLVALKPFVVGDYVQIGSDNNEGTVMHVRFFLTVLHTADNKVLLVPNGDVMSNQILNYTRRDHRRIDLTLGIGYEDDLRLAKSILTDIVAADDRVLSEPAPRVAIGDLGPTSVNLIVRPYVRTADYDATRTDLLEQIKLRFDEAGILLYPPRAVPPVVVASAPGATKKAG